MAKGDKTAWKELMSQICGIAVWPLIISMNKALQPQVYLQYQSLMMIDECRASVEWWLAGETRVLCETPVSLPFYLPWILYGLLWDWTQPLQ